MGKIRQLSSQIANMIAAGEVVERPMGVVKELVENAIDAGSTRIVVSIEEGGTASLTVEDNGCGMDADDAREAFKRHATSKIRYENDLWNIHTLGFRGEALPSIASVSKFTMCTSDGNDSTKIVMEYGEEKSCEAFPCPTGTKITVEGLFYRTPARLKHLRTASYEGSLIQNVIGSFALSHPEISFRLITSGRETFRTGGNGNLLEVLYQVYGRSAAENAIPLDFKDFDYHVTGYAVKPQINRSSRSMMHVFLNGRMVKEMRLYRAIQDGYEDFLIKGRFPLVVLNIEMDPHILDVNVHPSKWEVRISKQTQLEYLIKENLHAALKDTVLAAQPDVKSSKEVYYRPMSFRTEDLMPAKKETGVSSAEEVKAPVVTRVYEAQEREEIPLPEEPVLPTIEEETEEDNRILRKIRDQIEEDKPEYEKEKEPFPAMRLIGQLHGKYILAETEHGLAVIDRYCALCRIHFERIRKQMQGECIVQDLLVPVTVECTADVYSRIEEVNEALSALRIVFEPFGTNVLCVRSIPLWMEDLDEPSFLSDLLEDFRNERVISLDAKRRDKLAMQACQRSSGGNAVLSREEMEKILEDLSSCENPYIDPIGRNILAVLNEAVLLKELGR